MGTATATAMARGLLMLMPGMDMAVDTADTEAAAMAAMDTGVTAMARGLLTLMPGTVDTAAATATDMARGLLMLMPGTAAAAMVDTTAAMAAAMAVATDGASKLPYQPRRFFTTKPDNQLPFAKCNFTVLFQP